MKIGNSLFTFALSLLWGLFQIFSNCLCLPLQSHPLLLHPITSYTSATLAPFHFPVQAERLSALGTLYLLLCYLTLCFEQSSLREFQDQTLLSFWSHFTSSEGPVLTTFISPFKFFWMCFITLWNNWHNLDHFLCLITWLSLLLEYNNLLGRNDFVSFVYHSLSYT